MVFAQGDAHGVSAVATSPFREGVRQLSRRNALSSLTGAAVVALSAEIYLGKDAMASDLVLGFKPITLNGYYSGHLQGFCTNQRDSVYWSMTTSLVKTGIDGVPLKSVAVPNHHGDCCYLDGKIYVAVNLGRFNNAKKLADSWIYVYDAEDLSLLSKHEVNQVVYGAGGMAYGDGKFLVVGGLPVGFNENYLYEYDRNFKFIREVKLPSGYTFLGVQTVAYSADHWWLGCYGYPEMTLKVSKDFTKIQKFAFDSSLGIEQLNAGTYLVADGSCSKSQGCMGAIRPKPLDKWIADGVLRPLDNRTVGAIPPWR